MAQPLLTLVEWKRYRFLIMDSPKDMNLHIYLEHLKAHKVTDMVRVCEEKEYSAAKVEEAGIRMHELAFVDGAAPPQAVLDEWLNIVDARFRSGEGNTVAVHCVAGLGRAPVLVAVALIEAGLEWEQAVDHIRSKRRGVINAKQLRYLQQYKPRKRGCCTVQ